MASTAKRPSSAPPDPAGFDGAELSRLFTDFNQHERIALAVSGGADSTVLMVLARRWLDALSSAPPKITILTVDHGLRAEAAEEARRVAEHAARLGFAHAPLRWAGPKPRTGLPAAARKARYALMDAYCREHAITALATAHTLDDQAETLLMRLARGSGVDGLAAMTTRTRLRSVALLRPLLDVSRARIEYFLRTEAIAWSDDPTNRNTDHERVRVRQALRSGALGLSPESLALTASRLNRARAALEAATGRLLQAVLTLDDAGFATLRLAALQDADEEIAIRALNRLTMALGGRETPVRLANVEAACQMLRREPRSFTLGGCQFALRGERLTVTREFGRMTQGSAEYRAPVLWDRRFEVDAGVPVAAGLTLRPLGADGLKAARAAKLGFASRPRAALLALPSLWRGDHLVYAPCAEFQAEIPSGWLSGAAARFTNRALLLG
jgi:tRNA(Ile)-lysidine synthase